MQNKKEYSVIIPVYNEEENISQLDKEIKEVMKKVSNNYEIIYINDGSTDNSSNILKKLDNIKIINLNKNYGQSTALDAGFKEAKGELVISLDGDGQNNPADIPKLINKLKKEDLDVVAGWRTKREDKKAKILLSKTGNFFRKIFLNDKVHDTGCTLRVYKNKAVKSLDLQGEMHRYILALLKWKGFRIGEIPVNHRKRKNGKSNYGYKKSLKGFVDLIYVWFILKFSQRPLHIFGLLGVISFISGIVIEVWMVIEKILGNINLSSNAWFSLGFFLIIAGILFFGFGIVLDLLIKTYHNTSPYEQRYYIREILEK